MEGCTTEKLIPAASEPFIPVELSPSLADSGGIHVVFHASGSTSGFSLSQSKTDLFPADYRNRIIYLTRATVGVSQQSGFLPLSLRTERVGGSEDQLIFAQTEQAWAMLAAKEFLNGYDEVDGIYDEA